MFDPNGTAVTVRLRLDELSALDRLAELAGSTRTAVVRVAVRRGAFGHSPGEIKAAIDELPPDLRRSGPRAAKDKVRSVLEVATDPGMSEAEIAAVAQVGRHRTGEVLRELLAAGNAKRDNDWPRRWLPVTEDGSGG